MAQGLEAGKGAAAWVCSGVGPEHLSQDDRLLQPGTPSPAQAAGHGSTVEAPDWVASSTASIETDLASKLSTD